MLEKPVFDRVPATEHAVIVYEAKCEVRVGDISWRTNARVVFDVRQFPSAVIMEKRGDLTPIARPMIGKRKRNGRESVAAQRIRGMLSRMNIPATIGGQLDQLREIAAQFDWDGPEAVTEIRNSLAHPARRKGNGAAFEASQLAMWYLEMALLYLFEFKGKCENRTIFEKPLDAQESVPWAAMRDAP